jgi:hypothetical protein
MEGGKQKLAAEPGIRRGAFFQLLAKSSLKPVGDFFHQ